MAHRVTLNGSKHERADEHDLERDAMSHSAYPLLRSSIAQGGPTGLAKVHAKAGRAFPSRVCWAGREWSATLPPKGAHLAEQAAGVPRIAEGAEGDTLCVWGRPRRPQGEAQPAPLPPPQSTQSTQSTQRPAGDVGVQPSVPTAVPQSG